MGLRLQRKDSRCLRNKEIQIDRLSLLRALAFSIKHLKSEAPHVPDSGRSEANSVNP